MANIISKKNPKVSRSLMMMVATFLFVSVLTIPNAYAESPTFDKPAYGLDETATITLEDVEGGGAKTVTVNSSTNGITDPDGFELILTEIDGTGTYQGIITFTTDSSVPESGILQAAVGDFIVATFGEEEPAIASITAESTPEFGLLFQFEEYNLSAGAVGSAPVIITLTDLDADTDSSTQETVDISVTSELTGDSIILTLTETEAGSGVFTNTNLIFMTGNDLVRPGLGQITQEEPLLENNDQIDTLSVTVSSTSFPPGLPLELTETGPNTGLFRDYLTFSDSSESGGSVLQIADSDIVSVTYNDESENGLVIPNDPGIGAIQSAIGDTITASYPGTSDTATIQPGLGGGGGGGGLIRPGLVLNLLAGLTSGIDMAPPSLHFGTPTNTQDGFGGILVTDDNNNAFPLVINGKGYYLPAFSTFIDPVQVNTGQDVDLTLTFLESTGVEHVAIHLVDENNDAMSDTDAVLTFHKGDVTKVDPEGILADNITFSTSKENNKYSFNFGFSFDEPTNRHLLITAWDNNKNSGNSNVYNAFAVSGDSIPDDGTSHMIYLDLGAYFITANGIFAAGEKPDAVGQPVIEYDYPDSVGRTERHDGIMYDQIANEKAKANQVMAERFNLDTQTFVANDEEKPYDTSRRASELYLSSVGHKLRDFTLSPEENEKLIKELSWKEHLKAQKILDSLLVASKYHK